MEGSSDGLKWFGEGFDGFPKILSEDCVEYSMFIVDSKLTDFDIRDRLRQVQLAAEKLTKVLLRGFIWQSDGFKLTLERVPARSYLHGRTNYGDSVDDEWLIIYILRELSRDFSDVWMRAVDTDGQFLLSEAANALPMWLNPEIADYRVWINNGKLLIIPLEKPGGRGVRNDGGSDNISLEDAIEWIDDPDRSLQHSAKVEAEAFFRLRKYPQQIHDSLHHAMIPLPRRLACILHTQPSYVSAAIEAFYLRDPIALRPLRAKDAKGLLFDPRDLVNMSTTFTKVGYAQLNSQEFPPPPPWAKVIRDMMNADLKSHIDVGMKLSCGFEMLLSDKQNQDKQVVREINLLLEDMAAGEAQLPSDDEVQDWGTREDSESWLDIDFTEFEKELDGKAARDNKRKNEGFGDKAAQENLQKMVERFQGFLEEDQAGSEGAGFVGEMDYDDSEDSGEASDSVRHTDRDGSEGQNVEPDFNEDEFTAMMRELMGMPPEVMKEVMTNKNVGTAQGMGDPKKAVRPVTEASPLSSEDGDKDDEQGILQAMRETGEELREAGALND